MADSDLERLYEEPEFTGGFPPEVVRGFRKLVQIIDSAPDERTFRALKSLHYEKLKGKRARQRSMRINKQWRLIVEITERHQRQAGEGEGEVKVKVVLIVAIEDYHGKKK